MTAEALPAELRRALARIARTPRLLIACDYDGTLAPIVNNPDRALPSPEAVRALRALADLYETTAAVISGRALRDLAALSRLPSEVQLVGSHGSEFDIGFVHAIDSDARTLHRRLEHELTELVDGEDGVSLEVKPASVTVHVRRADPATAERVLAAVREGPAARPGVHVTEGKAVIELAVVATDKGRALDILRRRVGATAAIFLGDDVTDEKAFARLSGPDVGIKVGDGNSLADYRIEDAEEVASALAFLVEERRTWLHGERSTPIERLTMLANERAVALLSPEAKLCWMCHPEADSAALFADLLGGPSAGHFSIHPERGGLPLGQRYIPGTMNVQTRYPGLRVTDYFDHYTEPHCTELVRVVEGDVPTVVEFVPRPEFGGVAAHLEQDGEGLRVLGTPEPIVLRAPGVRFDINSDGEQDTARAVLKLRQGQPVVLELRCGTTDLAAHEVSEPDRRARAAGYSRDWLSALTLPPAHPELVGRSALTLRGLCNADTGGVLAAATTSLPEDLGGIRNWDYRYCWLRDGAMTVKALLSLGSATEAESFLGWLQQVLAELPSPERLRPLYTAAGTLLGTEAVIDTLPGYAGSRPVRVGNLANQQVQLDVFGPVVELVGDLSAYRGKLTDDDWHLVVSMTEAVAARWAEPDHGVWEERARPRHHVYSKVMCWATIDRALTLAAAYDRDVDPTWRELRSEIAVDVLQNGWSAEVGAFTTAYDGTDLDAASLHVGLSGLVAPTDERFVSTVTAIEHELRSGSTVYRYRRDDSLPGAEGGFHLCAAWMVEAYLLIGRRTEAEELFDQLVAAAGPTGLLPEEYDPVAERSLGNHPQAYSHLGLIRCAQLLSE
jgi:trehalose-phosphatase